MKYILKKKQGGNVEIGKSLGPPHNVVFVFVSGHLQCNRPKRHHKTICNGITHQPSFFLILNQNKYQTATATAFRA